jgi:hypothetical protein
MACSSPQQLQASSIGNITDHIGNSRAEYNLINYIGKFGAKTVVIEKDYIDNDYLNDYFNFHSHLFNNISKFTKRVHLFSGTFDSSDLTGLFDRYNTEQSKIKEVLGDYLGFFILKPIEKINGLSAPIGRSLLAPPDKSESCKYTVDEYQATLYGLPLKIETLPFQTKDSAVGLCATVSLWVLTKKMNKIFKTPLLSPYEITKLATEYIEPGRMTPYDGLTSRQMLSFFKSIKVDYNMINIKPFLNLSDQKNLVTDVIRAFIHSAKLPIIANLELIKKGKPSDFHSVVICGYKQSPNNFIEKLFVHDDAIGPFTEVYDNSSPVLVFSKWDYDWKRDFREEKAYDEISLIRLLIPFNPSIKLSFNDIYFNKYRAFKEEAEPDNTILYLASVSEYKHQILKSNCKDKLHIIEKPMPRFLWIMSSEKDNVKNDLIFDATAHYARPIYKISYE